MLGWIEGGNLQIDYRFFADAGPDRVAEELVNLRPDLILALTGAGARAVQQRTAIIPIVFVGGGDAASTRLVDNIARPSGNMTGFAVNFASVGGKWLELFKEAIPSLTRVAHIVSAFSVKDNSRSEFSTTIDAAAARLGVTIVRVQVHDTAEIEPAISAFAAAPHGGLLLTGGGPPAYFEAARLALHYRLPLMYGPSTPSTIVGGAEGVLMSHGPDFLDLTRRAASYVDRILRGAKPSELPVQYPSKFELVVNLKN
jgi:putative ABC transport system substrate-binding protein